jgi:hypothetical protein
MCCAYARIRTGAATRSRLVQSSIQRVPCWRRRRLRALACPCARARRARVFGGELIRAVHRIMGGKSRRVCKLQCTRRLGSVLLCAGFRKPRAPASGSGINICATVCAGRAKVPMEVAPTRIACRMPRLAGASAHRVCSAPTDSHGYRACGIGERAHRVVEPSTYWFFGYVQRVVKVKRRGVRGRDELSSTKSVVTLRCRSSLAQI